MTEVASGSRVTMHFSITLENGTVAEDSFDNEPLTFTVGDGTLHEALEAGLYGLGPGDEKTMLLPAESSFGYHNPDNIHDMPRADFDDSMKVEAGMVIGFTTPAGDELPGIILSEDEGTVRVDFNHPLAGHDLTYRVKILDVQPAE